MADEVQGERTLKMRVGIFVLVSIVAGIGAIYALGARARLFETRYTLHAEFTEVGGLSTGATVRLAGVQIGRVTGVHLPREPGGRVRVDLSIGRQFQDRIRRDSVARIETQGLLGDRIVEVSVGTAAAPAARPGEALASRDPLDMTRVFSEGAQTMKSVAALAESVRAVADDVQKSNVLGEVSATAQGARRVTEQVNRAMDQVEKGAGWAHVLLYEEPATLKRVDDALVRLSETLDRITRGEGAVGVLTSPESTQAARRLLAVMDRLGGMAERPGDDESLLAGLLFDPKYRSVLDDFRTVTRNFREVSERILGGRGTVGSLVRDAPGDEGLRLALEDLRAAMGNLRAITAKIDQGEGTLGALIADPTVYERLVSILEGAQRSSLIRIFLRGLGTDGKDGKP
ncbi:MAG: MCE family protein [Candidatus Rokubacteria bacterium]|nr:MCE family protein [Candidatus Rokubacteria bacterium]MBI3825428.1 MCE family protein [Candidatus Rokubacteria bacterium]